MGAIQGSINNVIGTAAAGLAAAKHVHEQKEANINKAYDELINIGSQAKAVDTEANAAIEQMTNVAKEAKAWSTLEAKTPEDLQAKEELKQEIDWNEQKARVALETAKTKTIAMSRQAIRSNKILTRAGLIPKEQKDKKDGGKK